MQPPRPLTPPEASLWIADQVEPINFTTVAQIEGPMVEDALREQLAAAQARHPLLRVAIEDRGGQPVLVGTDARFVPQLEDAPASALDISLARELRTPIDWRRGPLVRCVWMRHSATSSHLLLTFHHSIGDANSGIWLLRDILDGNRTPLRDDGALWDRLPQRARGLRGLFLLFMLLAREASRALRFGPPRMIAPSAKATLGERTPMIARYTLDEAQTEQLATLSRDQDTTVHGTLCALLLQSLAVDFGKSSVTISCASPADLRKQLEPPAADDVGYFVGATAGTYRVTPADSPWPLAQKIRRDVARDANNGTSALFHRIGTWALRFLLWRNKTARQIAETVYDLRQQATGLTNLGKLQIGTDFGALRVPSVSFVVAPSALGDYLATATSHGGRLHWNFIGMAPTLTRERFDHLHQDAFARLEALLRAEPHS